MPEVEKPKLVREFNLMPAARLELQRFMDIRFDDLHRADKKTVAELKELIGNIFPMDTLKEVLQGKSEFAILVHGCPERALLRNSDTTDPQETYNYYIAQALYASADTKHVKTESVGRSSHRNRNQEIVGPKPHRDALNNIIGNEIHVGDSIILSCPLNDEHAFTQVIHMQRAIEDLTLAQQENVHVTLQRRLESDLSDEPPDTYTLKEVLQELKHPPRSGDFIQQITPCSPESEETLVFTDAIKRNSTTVNLQPGGLLIFNEHHIFHCAEPGNPEKIAAIPPQQSLSRLVMHHGGSASSNNSRITL